MNASIYSKFAGKSVAISGATGGIGKALSNKLHATGAQLVLIDRDGGLLQQERNRYGEKARTVVCDQADASSVQAAIEEVGAVDIFINNAGMTIRKPLLDMSQDELRKLLDVNLVGAMLMAIGLARFMVERKSGVIINVASQLAFASPKERGIYSVSKAGLVQFTRSAAHEWIEHGVRMAAIAPGAVDTPMTAALQENKAALNTLVSRIPLGRLSTVDEVSDVILFLASDIASTIVGHVLVADGGYLLS